MDTCSLEEGVMVKDILGITAAIVTLTVGIAFTFWAVPRPPPTIAAAQTAGVKPAVGEIAAVTVHGAVCQRPPHSDPPGSGKLSHPGSPIVSQAGSPILSHPGSAIGSHPVERDRIPFSFSPSPEILAGALQLQEVTSGGTEESGDRTQ